MLVSEQCGYIMNDEPCQKEVSELQDAIKAWVQASEATRRFMVTLPLDSSKEPDTFPPGYFYEMQEAYEREREARGRYIIANKTLYDCKELHGLID